MTLTKKTIENISMVGALRMFSKILNAITLIILARLLTPSDFGIVAIAGLFTTILEPFRDFGLKQAIVHRKERLEESYTTAFTLRLIVSSFLFILVFLLAKQWANFFNDPKIASVVRIFSILLILDNFSFVPDTRLTKELRFKSLVIPDFLGRFIYSAVAIFLALNGYSFWSLIYGKLIQSVVMSISFWIILPWSIHLKLDKEIAKGLIGYGKYVLGTAMITIAMFNLDNAVIGKIIGSTALGYYLIAFRWADFSTLHITNTFHNVLLPTYSLINDDVPRLRKAYLKSLKYSSMVAIPVTFGTFAIAPEFVINVLGEKWSPAVLPLRILCIYGLFHSINATTGSLFYAIGKPKTSTFLIGIKFVLMILLIVPMTKLYGLIGVALLVSFLSILIFPINFSFILKYLVIKKKELSEILFPPTTSAIIMLFFIMILKSYKEVFTILRYSNVILIFYIISGGIIYTISLFFLTKGKLKDDFRILSANIKIR
jgi:O-antigen/teichoic acid export membrane protein